MQSFVVSARKHRPTRFSDVFGQSHITATLEQAIKHQRFAQAMLFCGPRGVGKTSCARIFAHQVNRFENQDPTRSTHSLNIFELDAASHNSVEDIRHLIEQIRFPPQEGEYKIYIIDEVHMLSQQAFNAFLKTLEEPPSYAIFILATTEKQKVLPTIRSRCQVFHFKRISMSNIVSCLQKISTSEHLEAEERALYEIARQADGSLRDALSLFDMLITFCEEKKLTYQQLKSHFDLMDESYFFELTRCLEKGALKEGLLMLDQAIKDGIDLQQWIQSWSEALRDTLLAKDLKTTELLSLSPDQLQSYQKESQALSEHFLVRSLSILNQGTQSFKQSQYPRLHLELMLYQISNHLSTRPQEEDLQVAAPEKKKP